MCAWDLKPDPNKEKPFVKDGGKVKEVVQEIERQESGKNHSRKESAKSKSSKRSNHRHKYVDICLLERSTKGRHTHVHTSNSTRYYMSVIRFCIICGRIKDRTYPWNHYDMKYDKPCSELQTGDTIRYKDVPYKLIVDFSHEFEYFNMDTINTDLINTAKQLLGLED